MTQEEKQLLLKDLCARLPYGVMVNYFSISQNSSIDAEVIGYSNGFIDIDNYSLNPEFVKPYLRPMSSMTDEECDEWEQYIIPTNIHNAGGLKATILYDDVSSATDWLIAHHFDYRGLISMGLALEAPEDMYKEG